MLGRVLRGKALYIGTGVALAAALLGAVYILYAPGGAPYSEAATIAEGAKDFDELSDRFEELAKDKGGVYAFEVLKRAPLPPNTDTHLLGHVVGDQLYLQEGVDGIQYCTQDFRNACSHTIVIGALQEFGGEAALDLIRDACKKAPGGRGAYTMCYHGLGHGVFAFFSYEFPETIEFCKKTGTEEYRDREYIECVGGAVMELMGGGGHDKEAWEKSREKYLVSPLSPCMDSMMPDDVKEICIVYATPQLWEAAGINMGRPEPEKFKDAFKFCDKIPREKQSLRNACFGGFGKEFPTLANARDIRNLNLLSDESLALVVTWCSYAPHDEGRKACTESALHSLFWGGENDPELSFRFCKAATDRSSVLGRSCEMALASDIRQYLGGDARSSLCARLSGDARAMCTNK